MQQYQTWLLPKKSNAQSYSCSIIRKSGPKTLKNRPNDDAISEKVIESQLGAGL